jgi:Bacterial Ig-like domain (group 2)/Glucodextranase, domain B/Bacterial Ig-like domain
MIKKKNRVLLFMAIVVIAGILGMVCGADASSNYPGIYNGYFGTTPSCSLCHTSPPSLNATGTTFFNAGENTVAGWNSIKPADTTPPTVTITTPATNPYPASSSPLSIAGTASDNFTGPFGVTQISWSNSLGGSGTATGTTSWSASIPLSSGSNVITVTARDQAGNTKPATLTVTYTPADTTPPTVTINQASGQADPTGTSPINFTVVFSESVTGFTSSDVTVAGTAGGTKAVVVTGGPSTYNVAVSGMTSGGTVIASIAAGMAQDAAGNLNTVSTSTDNTVTYAAAPVLTTITVVPAATSIAVGATQQFTATARDQNGNPMSPQPAFTWSSANTAIATVNSSGLATGVAAGGPVSISAKNGAISGSASLTVSSATTGPDLSIWVGQWLKLTIENRGYYSEDKKQLSNDHHSFSAYLKITAWDPNNKVLQATLFGHDEEGDLSATLSLHYISGTDLDFLCWSQITLGDSSYGFTAHITGVMEGGVLVDGTLTTTGGYHAHHDAEQSSNNGHVGGWLKIRGKLISEGKVPSNFRQ